MKKILALLVLVFTCQMAFCQTYNELINKYKDKPNAEYKEMSKQMLAEAMEDLEPEIKTAMKSIDKMKILELDNCNQTVKKEFWTQVAALENKYTKLDEENENGETVIIFTDGEEEPIKAIIMASKNAKECGLIVIEGNMSTGDFFSVMVFFIALGAQ